MKRRLLPALTLLLALSALSASLSAQIAGTIAGVVRDASGAVLPGVTVRVTGPTLQRESVTVVSGPDGAYRIPLVPAGEYAVNAELSGFQPQRREAVRVSINQEV